MTNTPSSYPLTALSLAAISTVMTGTAINVGLKRKKYQINAPETNGPPEFLYALRIQQNTLEQAGIVVPSLIAFAAVSKNDKLAGGLGLTWAFSRILYGLGYPSKRETGFLVGFLTSMALIDGTIFCVVRDYLKK